MQNAPVPVGCDGGQAVLAPFLSGNVIPKHMRQNVKPPGCPELLRPWPNLNIALRTCRLGMLVWQDMPSAWLGADKDKAQWEHELSRMILVWALIYYRVCRLNRSWSTGQLELQVWDRVQLSDLDDAVSMPGTICQSGLNAICLMVRVTMRALMDIWC